MDLQEAQTALAEAQRQLTEEKSQTARLSEALLLRDARDFARNELAGIDMPDVTRTRLAESLANAPIVKDGAIDREAFKAKIRETATVELKYLETATGRGSVRGMGASGNVDDAKAAKASLTESFKRMGMSETSAAGAAAHRGN